jgi:hypothetical protein
MAIAGRRRTVADRWTPEIAKAGHIPIARSFLRGYRKLDPPITFGEAMLLVHLLDYKWDSAAPWPSFKTLAGHMGLSDKQARRLAKSLARKGCLRIEQRTAHSNLFHFEPLFEKLEALLPVQEQLFPLEDYRATERGEVMQP